jgi:hypothetical protein
VNELPQVTLDTLSAVLGSGVTLVYGEDCEEAIGEALHHTQSNSDHCYCYRSDTQCYCACQRQTWFKTTGRSGVFYVNGMLSLVLNNRHASGYMEVRPSRIPQLVGSR